MPFPTITEAADYRAFKKDEAARDAAIDQICARHNIGETRRVKFENGSTIVYAVGDDLVVKLYSPLHPKDLETEQQVLAFLTGKLPVATPEVRHFGDMDGWPYLIMSRVPGTPMLDVWDRIPATQKQRLCRETGALMRFMHGLPVTELGPMAERDWPAYLAERQAKLEQHHTKKKTPPAWLAQIEPAVAAVDWAAPQSGPALLHTEFMRDHVLVTENAGRWELSGLIDFEPAMVGEPEYDLASAFLFVTGGDPELNRAFMDGYGYSAAQRDETFRLRLMGYLLIHEQSNLPWYFEFMPGSEQAVDLADLRRDWLDC